LNLEFLDRCAPCSPVYPAFPVAKAQAAKSVVGTRAQLVIFRVITVSSKPCGRQVSSLFFRTVCGT